MAVQAQYPPSNVLLLNRNMQEVNDFSLQPQAAGGGLFLVQSTPHILFASGGGAAGSANHRRIGKEMQANTPATNSLQPQTTQLFDLPQLRNHYPSKVVATGLRLSFGGPQQLQLQQQQRPRQQQGLVYNPKPSALASMSLDLAAETKQQREEIDQFVHAQGEHLRRLLAEKQEKHYRVLLGAVESSVTHRLREKEAEVEEAAQRQANLAAREAQLVAEAQQWQAKARAQEAVAVSLQTQLQQAQARESLFDRGGVKAAVEGSAGGGGDAEDAESAYVDPERVEMVGPNCRACRRRAATVVVLPCRHLCACPECDRLAQACPLCFCQRSSSVEVFLS